MRHRFARLIAVALILSTVACGSGDGPEYIWFRVMHTMPDSPNLRITYEDYVFRQSVAYATSTAEGGESLLSGAGPTAHLTATYFEADGSLGDTLLSLDVPVEKDHSSTVVFAGGFDDPQAITVVSPRLERPLGAMHVQFVHAALDQGALDVYVTAPDTELTSTAPLTTLQPRDHSGILEIPFGESRIRLTPAGSLDVLMDSGELDFPETEAATGPGMQWLFAIAPSVVPGPSPLFLLGSTGRDSFRFRDAGTPATLRAMHALPDTPPVDVVIAATTPITLFADLEYGSRTPLLAAPLGNVPLAFRESGEGGQQLATETSEFSAAQQTSAFLIGPSEEPGILFNGSQGRSVVTEAKLRFANLAPDSQFFSVYQTSTADETRDASNRLLRDLRFGVASGHIVRTPGDYFLTITQRFFENQEDAADAPETVVFGPMPLELVGGDVFTWAILAPQNEGEPEVLLQFDDRDP